MSILPQVQMTASGTNRMGWFGRHPYPLRLQAQPCAAGQCQAIIESYADAGDMTRDDAQADAYTQYLGEISPTGARPRDGVNGVKLSISIGGAQVGKRSPSMARTAISKSPKSSAVGPAGNRVPGDTAKSCVTDDDSRLSLAYV